MKFSGVGKRRAAALAAVALTAVTGAVVGAGQADAGRLPGGRTKAVGVDGQVVEISRSGESSRIMPSLAANGAGRAAAVSGTYKTTLSKGTGVMTVGYLVGCQVNLTGFTGTLSGSFDLSGGVSGSGSLSVPLAPGQVVYAKTDKISLKKSKGTIMVDSFSIDVQQCGGYASARSVVQVVAADGYDAEEKSLSGNSGYVQANLLGTPFSLG
ncbi:MspA family porin [Gordonia sp. PS3]|uniref:MspA family porin n=1 Tax=Gordonia TaxID=2053 RepID=UPI0005EF2363|nr:MULTISPECIES: MspA family porin [Gordonia]KJR06944.1 hypothetical protein UG54_12230 [Gordonia sihwensis]KXT56481.1 hypothetical protein Y710_13440 [Gordonia sp. QH-12]WFN93592.1 MspA family porin [Gordonia sihwensis]